MKFYVYNTLGREKQEIIPIEKDFIKLYTCGPTVYNYAHIGNLRTYIFEDILKKSLKYVGLNVKHVMNITDVGHLQSDGDEGEDKMALGAAREHKTVLEIAKFYEEAFFDDCNKLNIQKPDICCRATEHIKDMIDFIKKLENKGYTYISNGNVYFEIDKFKEYNKLANLSMDELEAGSRVEVDENKKNPLDFVLWFTNSKFKNQIMQWDSPWGRGFPGWHLECSTMSIKYLGENIDIHCGGVDHIPVHHTNEIAQSEAALGHKWVNYWMHGEFLVLDGGKMSKSKGDFLTLSKIIDEGFSPMDYRFFCLNSRYRKQLIFSYENLKDAQNSLKRMKSKIKFINENKTNQILNREYIEKYRAQFADYISDDLNIPNAITVIYDLIKDDKLSNDDKVYLIKDFDKVLSLDLFNTQNTSLSNDEETIINNLIYERNKARKDKNWALADEIREKLNKMNVKIIDTKEGSLWEK